MRRLGNAIVLALSMTVVLGGVSRASAFHTGSTFGALPGAGGGGGMYYTGSRREHGWTCAACHTDSPGQLRVALSTDRGLLDTRGYVPGTIYQFTIAIEREHLGIQSTRSNYNGMAAAFYDENDVAAGTFVSLGPDVSFRGANVFSMGGTVALTSWSFGWVAPAAGTGPVTFSLAVVDGNGANAGPTVTDNDFQGDDVAAASVRFEESGVMSRMPCVRPFSFEAPPELVAALNRSLTNG